MGQAQYLDQITNQLTVASREAFFHFYIKKTKFQKYMPNREIFKNGCLSTIQLATGPKCKKNLHLGSDAQGALNSELVKSI